MEFRAHGTMRWEAAARGTTTLRMQTEASTHISGLTAAIRCGTKRLVERDRYVAWALETVGLCARHPACWSSGC